MRSPPPRRRSPPRNARARPSRPPRSTSGSRRSVRRSAGASAVRSSPPVHWCRPASPNRSRPSSDSTRSSSTSSSRAARCCRSAASSPVVTSRAPRPRCSSSSRTAAAIRTSACSQFAESVVDPSTGTVTVRARFPNPEGWLLPGMYVRAEFAPVQDAARHPRAAAGRLARRAGQCHRARHRRRLEGRAAHRRHRPHGRRPVGGVERAEGWRSRSSSKAWVASRPARPCKPGRREAAEHGMISRIFIDRPVLAWVISILIMLGGTRWHLADAGRAVPGHRAAVREHPRLLSRRERPRRSNRASRRSSSSSSPASTG